MSRDKQMKSPCKKCETLNKNYCAKTCARWLDWFNNEWKDIRKAAEIAKGGTHRDASK